jgi:putative RNA 2'-phosphotransferase
MRSNDRKLTYALRHAPEKFGLTMDHEGWVDLQDFLAAMGITRANLDQIMTDMDKQRFEVRDGRIRAHYGHSAKDRVQKQQDTPPDTLYHGTTPFAAYVIEREGIRPMGRQYAHLSSTPETARTVGGRRDPSPTILAVDAARAHLDGVKFYRGNEDVWLADHVPPEYIARMA